MAFVLSEILSKDSVLSPVLCYSKKKTFEEIAKKAAVKTQLPMKDLIELLILRENIGSTYIANGFAMPHCVIPDEAKECAILVILEKPVHYNFVENNYADIVLALFLHKETIINNEEALQNIVAQLSKVAVTRHLRYIKNIATQVYGAITNYVLANLEKDKDKDKDKEAEIE